jgi:hypothetical protein
MLQQKSDTQPITLLNPPKVINTCLWLPCEGCVGCTMCCAMSAGLAPSSCNQENRKKEQIDNNQFPEDISHGHVACRAGGGKHGE